MRKLLLALPLLGLAACAEDGATLDPGVCLKVASAIALAEVTGNTEVPIGDKVYTVAQAREIMAILCPYQ